MDDTHKGIVVCTSFASLYRTTEILKAGDGEWINTIIICRDLNNAAEADWHLAGYLDGLDRSNNPLTIMGGNDLWERVPGHGKRIAAKFGSIFITGCEGVTFYNVSADTWHVAAAKANFVDCVGSGLPESK